MSMSAFTLALFLAGMLAGISGTILLGLVPDTLRAARHVCRVVRTRSRSRA